MTQRPFRPGRVATAGIGAIAGGVAVAAVRPEGEHISVDTTGIVPIAIATTVALGAMRRWLTQHEARTTATVRTLAEQHRLRSEELDSREQAVTSRERVAARDESLHALRISGLAQRLDDAHTRLGVKTQELEELRANYTEVMEDHNALVAQVLQQGAKTFTIGAGDAQRPVRNGIPRRSDEHQRGTSPVTFLQPREHQESV